MVGLLLSKIQEMKAVCLRAKKIRPIDADYFDAKIAAFDEIISIIKYG